MFIDGAYDDVQGCQLPPAPPLPHVLWAPTSNLAPQVSLHILSYHLDHFDHHDNHQCGQAPRRRRGRERLASAWISSWIQRGDFLFQWWMWMVNTCILLETIPFDHDHSIVETFESQGEDGGVWRQLEPLSSSPQWLVSVFFLQISMKTIDQIMQRWKKWEIREIYLCYFI